MVARSLLDGIVNGSVVARRAHLHVRLVGSNVVFQRVVNPDGAGVAQENVLSNHQRLTDFEVAALRDAAGCCQRPLDGDSVDLRKRFKRKVEMMMKKQEAKKKKKHEEEARRRRRTKKKKKKKEERRRKKKEEEARSKKQRRRRKMIVAVERIRERIN